MKDASDAELLCAYATNGDEAAFREIVTRHAGLVYSAALRQSRSPEAARDIAQAVFADLARKARSLEGRMRPHSSLVGWLYRSTRFAALTELRDSRRRRARETEAMHQFEPSPAREPNWEQLEPMLDEAMSTLPDEDREAVLLRFFRQSGFRAIGQALGVSDDAAQKRVSRALEKLRGHLARRGITTSAAALSILLSANAPGSAPAGLAMLLSASALTGASVGTATGVTATKIIAMTTFQKAIAGTTLAALVGTGVYQMRLNSDLKAELTRLRDQHAALVRQTEQQRNAHVMELTALRDENESLRANSSELLALRGQVARLRDQERDSQTRSDSNRQTVEPMASNSSVQAGRELPVSSWEDAGFATPQAALRTRGWSVLNGNRERFKESVHITPSARATLENLFLKMAQASTDVNKAQYIDQMVQNQLGIEDAFLMPLMAENRDKGYTGYRILSERSLRDDEVVLDVETRFASGTAQTQSLTFQRLEGNWKLLINDEFVKALQQ